MAKENTTLYLIGGGVVFALAAWYFLLRPKAAYAQPGVAPGLPGPGVPPPPEVYEPAPEVLPPDMFAVGSRAFMAPLDTPGGRVAELRKQSSGAWFGYTSGGAMTAGNVWQTIGDAARDPDVAIFAIASPAGAVLWQPGQVPLEAYA